MDRTDCRPSPNRHRCTHLRAKDEADGLHTCLFFSFFFSFKRKKNIYVFISPFFFWRPTPTVPVSRATPRPSLVTKPGQKKNKILLTEESKVMRAKIISRVDWISLRYVFFSSSSPLPSRRLMTRARKLHSRQVRCQQTRCDYMRGEKNWPATGSPWLPVVHTSDPYVLCAVVFVLVLLHYSSHVADSQEDD